MLEVVVCEDMLSIEVKNTVSSLIDLRTWSQRHIIKYIKIALQSSNIAYWPNIHVSVVGQIGRSVSKQIGNKADR